MKVPAAVSAIALFVLSLMGRAAPRAAVPVWPAVPVCVTHQISPAILQHAEEIGSRMFAGAGLAIEWHTWRRTCGMCPAASIWISLPSTADSHGDAHLKNPNVLAYAFPHRSGLFEGPQVVLFVDRITLESGSDGFPNLLAHVLVHEVTHILQGASHHSTTGVMKSGYSHEEIISMRYRPLLFSREDLELIHAGMKARAAQLARQPERQPEPAEPEPESGLTPDYTGLR